MTNKRHDWMTPEEAARELKPGEFVWVYWNRLIEQGYITAKEIILMDSCYRHALDDFDKICRAIVPEVPSE